MERIRAPETALGQPDRCLAARRATWGVQRVCRQTVKYPGTGVLHDLSRRDAGLHRT
jgi:hypothetical protein